MSTGVNQGNGSRYKKSKVASDNVTLDTQEIKSQLLDLLHRIDQLGVGSFATYGTLPLSANPGLYVHGLGIVGLPLSERLATELAGVCHQAPFGKGSKTIVDTTVRKTWELDSSQFELRNPAWQACVKDVLQSVGKDLGIVGGMSSMSAQLYKMLLSERGAFFERHKDLEKAPGMFGTLVIALPSSHTGGEVEVKFNGQRQTLKTAEASGFGYTYLAWYADVVHSVRPITSGYRLVLIYNLIHTAPWVPQLAASLGNEILELGDLLSQWKNSLKHSKAKCPKMLAYMLQHKYTDANLHYDYLKGKDRSKTQYMKEACKEQGFCMFLANLERIVLGGCDEVQDCYSEDASDDDESDDDKSDDDHDEYGCSKGLTDYHKINKVIESRIHLKLVLDADGSKTAEDIDLQEDDIVQENPFARNPDDEDYSGYTGNQGVSATHFYRNSCLIIFPKDYQIDVLFDSAKKGTKDINAWIGNLIEEYSVKPQDRKRKANLIQLCELVADTNKARSGEKERGGNGCFSWRKEKGFSDDTLGLVAKAALHLRNLVLFENAASATGSGWPSLVFYDIGQTLGELEISDWLKGLEMATTSTVKIHQVYEALTYLWDGYTASQSNDLGSRDSNVLHGWVRQRIKSSISVNTPIFKEDGKALGQIARMYGEGYMFQNILPLVKQHLSTDTSISVAFLESLFDAGDEGKVRKEVVSNVFRDILCNVIPYLKIEFNDTLSKRMRPMNGIRSIYEPQLKSDDSSSSTFVAGNDVAMLVGCCTALHLDEEVDQILARVRGEAAAVGTSAFQVFLLPFLKSLVDVMQRHKIPYTQSRYQVCFQRLLELYVQRYIGAEPPAPQEWAKPRRGCGCTDCQELDRFLVDPNRTVGRFSVAEKRRRHIVSQIGNTCENETERKGLPYTLVVTKNEHTWKEALKAWQQRCDEAARNIQDIGLPALKDLLADRYTELTEFTAMRLGAPPPTRTPLVTTSQARAPADAVAKTLSNNLVPRHPSHIIDLTE